MENGKAGGTDQYQLFQLTAGVKEQRGPLNNKWAGPICSCSEGGGGVRGLLTGLLDPGHEAHQGQLWCDLHGGWWWGRRATWHLGPGGGRSVCQADRKRVREEEVLLAIRYSRR